MEQPKPLEPAQVVTILTTEHFALQGARAAALTDMQGRANLFTTAVSSTLVALALVANVAKLGPAFEAFAFILLPTLYFFGVATFLRIVQISIEDTLRARGLARIRHWYLERAPELRPYFLTTTHDDFTGLAEEMGIRTSRLQIFLPTEAVIAFASSVLLGTFAGVLASLWLHADLIWAGLLGIALALLSVAFLTWLSYRHWAAIERDHPASFPSSPAG